MKDRGSGCGWVRLIKWEIMECRMERKGWKKMSRERRGKRLKMRWGKGGGGGWVLGVKGGKLGVMVVGIL